MEFSHNDGFIKRLLHIIFVKYLPIIRNEIKKLQNHSSDGGTCQAMGKIKKMEKQCKKTALILPYLRPPIIGFRLGDLDLPNSNSRSVVSFPTEFRPPLSPYCDHQHACRHNGSYLWLVFPPHIWALGKSKIFPWRFGDGIRNPTIVPSWPSTRKQAWWFISPHLACPPGIWFRFDCLDLPNSHDGSVIGFLAKAGDISLFFTTTLYMGKSQRLLGSMLLKSNQVPGFRTYLPSSPSYPLYMCSIMATNMHAGITLIFPALSSH